MGIARAMAALRDAVARPKPAASPPSKPDFDRALAIILRHEGGYVNHPRDPGGMTNLGVTRTTLESWLGRAVSEAEMRALTVADVAPIYRARYWDACRCDDLPGGLALCVFDFAVNAGPARAARFLQGMVGTKVDGKIGPQTLAVVVLYVARHGERDAIKGYQSRRADYYRSLRTFGTFGRGWLRRVKETEADALEMAA